jgi:hypothetical protein
MRGIDRVYVLIVAFSCLDFFKSKYKWNENLLLAIKACLFT